MVFRYLTGLPIVLRYLIAGGTSTAVDLGILYLLTEFFGWWYLTSATAAFVVAALVSFTLHKFYTFGHRDTSRRVVATQSAFYLTLAVTNVGINTALMYALVEWAGVWYFFAQIIAAAAIAVESFFVYRFFIFHTATNPTLIARRAVASFKRHRAAFFVSVVISLLYGTHHFLMPQFMPEGLVYKPVTYESDHDAGGYYGPRANAFFSRNQLDFPTLLPVLNPVIMGGLGKILGSMDRAYIFSDFLFPPLIFLSVYALAREILRRRLPSLILASVFLVSPLAALLSPSAPIFSSSAPLYFSSFEYPKVTFLFYALALLFIVRALERADRKNILLAGVFFGVLFYTYLYDWAYLAVALCITLCWFLLRREWGGAKSCAGVLGVGTLISLPYWLNFSALRRLPQYEDTAFRIGGLEVGRHFRFSSVWKTYARHIVLIGALVFTSLKRFSRITVFLSALLAAYFVVVNVQVVLGFSPQPDHWYRETFLPVMLTMGVVAVWLWNRYCATAVSKRSAGIFCSIFLVLFFAQAFYGQYRLSRDGAAVWGISQRYVNAYAWLNAHTEPGSVVGSIDEETNRDLLLFTHNVLLLPSGGTTLASNEELWRRVYALGTVLEVTPEQLRAFVGAHTYYLFQDYYRPRFIDSYFTAAKPRAIPEDELTVRISEFVEARRDRSRVIPYALNYIITGPREEVFSPVPASFASLPLVYDADGVKIYRFSYDTQE